MSLGILPKELLLMITDYLRLTAIESLALTFNKQITATCLPLLQELFNRRRHVKRMASIFSECSWNAPIGVAAIEDCREKFGISNESKIEMPTLSERFARLQYLDFKEDLHWLLPVDEETAGEMACYNTHVPLDTKQLDNLRANAASLGITLPPSFLKLFADRKLMTRVPSSSACFFEIYGGIRKVPAAIDQGKGGYSIRMYSDQQGCYYWDLYIEPGKQGRHCVLGSDFDSGTEWESLVEDEFGFCAATAEEQQGDVVMATMFQDDVSLDAFSFEEWLALNYFEQWLWFVLEDSGQPEEPLKEYVREMYVRDK